MYQEGEENLIGWCNSCGEEAEEALGCCDDGEVVPYE